MELFIEEFATVYEAFAWSAEKQLETLDILQKRFGTSKADLTRQQKIADAMVSACLKFRIHPIPLPFSPPPAVATPLLERALLDAGETMQWKSASHEP